MKKLTAGIFATILGLTTVNAFAATAGTKVASTGYVDGAVSATKTWVGEQGYLKDTNLTGYAKETWVEDKGYAVATEVTSAISTAKSEAISEAANAAAGLYETKESAKAYETKVNAAATYATKDDIKNMATSGQITDLGTRVGTIEADYLKEADIADMATNTVVAATYATQTSVNDLAGDVNENATAITNLQTADTTLQANIDKKLDSTTAATTYETKENAKAYAKTADLAAVATSGSYTDLTNVPTDLVTNAAIANMATKTDIANMATTGDVANAKQEAIDAAAAAVTAKGYATTKDVDDLHQAQAAMINANEVAIKNLQDADTAFATEQAEQDAEIAKKANSADVYAKTVADTTFVKVSDIVDTYPATQAAQQ